MRLSACALLETGGRRVQSKPMLLRAPAGFEPAPAVPAGSPSLKLAERDRIERSPRDGATVFKTARGANPSTLLADGYGPAPQALAGSNCIPSDAGALARSAVQNWYARPGSNRQPPPSQSGISTLLGYARIGESGETRTPKATRSGRARCAVPYKATLSCVWCARRDSNPH